MEPDTISLEDDDHFRDLELIRERWGVGCWLFCLFDNMWLRYYFLIINIAFIFLVIIIMVVGVAVSCYLFTLIAFLIRRA